MRVGGERVMVECKGDRTMVSENCSTSTELQNEPKQLSLLCSAESALLGTRSVGPTSCRESSGRYRSCMALQYTYGRRRELTII